jgi:hypothetical protein
LPDSSSILEESQSYVQYRIKEKEGNGVGITVLSAVYNYFDWNEAIITNTTLNIYNMKGAVNDEVEHQLNLYPMPTSDYLHCQSDISFDTVEILDAMGKIVFASPIKPKNKFDKLKSRHLFCAI